MEKLGYFMQSLAPPEFPQELDAVAQAHSKCIIYFNDSTTDFTEFNSPWFESAQKLFSKLMKGWYSILMKITQQLSLETASRKMIVNKKPDYLSYTIKLNLAMLMIKTLKE